MLRAQQLIFPVPPKTQFSGTDQRLFVLQFQHLKNILQGKLHDSGVHRTSDLPESIAIVQGRRIADRDASPDGGSSGKA